VGKNSQINVHQPNPPMFFAAKTFAIQYTLVIPTLLYVTLWWPYLFCAFFEALTVLECGMLYESLSTTPDSMLKQLSFFT